ncbi:MAG: DUF3151 domain-containing protein [Chloroflexota bacterium]|nr:DUF3151 domain-containing protein [Chloroflexota bacterium]
MADQPQFVDLSAQMAPPTALLPPDSPEAVAALAAAVASTDEGTPERLAVLREVARRWPASIAAWAQLAETALALGEDVEAYAFARTAYHRGLDRLRANGWRGTGLVPWSHEPNQGVMRALRALMLASERLGEADEAARLRTFLLDSDPTDPLGVHDA